MTDQIKDSEHTQLGWKAPAPLDEQVTILFTPVAEPSDPSLVARLDPLSVVSWATVAFVLLGCAVAMRTVLLMWA